MRVLVACEFSGIVRDAFIAVGADAWSCDIVDSERPGPHIRGDAIETIGSRAWDLVIAHPPCTYLANSGVQWLHKRPERWRSLDRAAAFFRAILAMPIHHLCVENPTPHAYARALIGVDYTQAIEPCWFGHAQTKRTCLWLRGLPPLMPTCDWRQYTSTLTARERMPGWWGGSRNKRERSRTFPGIAAAMATQWGLTYAAP